MAWQKLLYASDPVPTHAHDSEDVSDALGFLPGRVFNVMDPTYGAVGDGSTDDSTAINAAAAAAKAAGGLLVFPSGYSFAIASTVTIESDVFALGATITTTSTALAPAVQVGIDAGLTRRKTMFLPKIVTTGKSGAGWSGNDIGLRLVNLHECEVHIPHVKYFSTGVRCSSKTGTNAFVYNKVFIGHLENNKVNLHLLVEDTTSWCNENQFHGGRYSHDAPLEGTDVSGVRQILIETPIGAADRPNNNVWMGASIEGEAPEYLLEIIGGFDNYFIGVRWEAPTPKVYYNEADSTLISERNLILWGHKANLIEYTYSANSNRNSVWDNSHALTIDSNPGSTKSLLTLRHVNSDLSAAIRIVRSGENPLTGAPETAWTTELNAFYAKWKASTDGEARFRVVANTGTLEWGDGTAAPDVSLARASSTLLSVNSTTSFRAANFVATANGLQNSSTFNNAFIRVPTTGTEIKRNIADANPTLKVMQEHASSTGDIQQWLNSTTNVVLRVTRLGVLTFAEASDIAAGTTTGTKIGTAATQKLGFWNATPVVRPTGWGAPTGTPTRTTFATSTVTTAQLAERVKALIDDLTTEGLIGA